jgi:hypothetical protein
MNWKDTTPRSRQDPNKPASCWTLETKKMRITVLNSHRDDPGEWIVSCHQVNFNVKRIGVKPDAPHITAKAAAISLVKKELREMLESFNE